MVMEEKEKKKAERPGAWNLDALGSQCDPIQPHKLHTCHITGSASAKSNNDNKRLPPQQ
jgi:hypothetical protein